MDERKILYCDGACKSNNKKDQSQRRMFICYVDESIPGHFQIRARMQKGGSNNIAELLAIDQTLCYALNKGYKNILIRTDSQVVYHWIENGGIRGKVNNPEFTQKLLDRITRLRSWFINLEFQIVPRSLNKAGIKLEKKTKKWKNLITKH